MLLRSYLQEICHQNQHTCNYTLRNLDLESSDPFYRTEMIPGKTLTFLKSSTPVDIQIKHNSGEQQPETM